jgi:hypothetical protein
MLGGHYFSLVEEDENFCGGVHGARWTKPWVFDLYTGSLVNWQALLPPGWVDGAHSEQVWDKIDISVIFSGELQRVYRHNYNSMSQGSSRSDCQDVMSAAEAFILWPNAAKHGIELEPSSLPLVASACARPATLLIVTLRDLGFDRSLVDDIQTAPKHLESLWRR